MPAALSGWVIAVVAVVMTVCIFEHSVRLCTIPGVTVSLIHCSAFSNFSVTTPPSEQVLGTYVEKLLQEVVVVDCSTSIIPRATRVAFSSRPIFRMALSTANQPPKPPPRMPMPRNTQHNASVFYRTPHTAHRTPHTAHRMQALYGTHPAGSQYE